MVYDGCRECDQVVEYINHGILQELREDTESSFRMR